MINYSFRQTREASSKCVEKLLEESDLSENSVLPEISASCRRLDRSFYHLDGKGELPHLPQLLAEERLGGIQWVPGAGNPPFTEWEPIYREIADAGKKIWLAPGGDFDGASRIMDATGHPERFVLCDAVPPERESDLLRFRRRYGAE